MQCTWPAVLVSATVLFLERCSTAEIVRNASIIWTPEEEFVVPSSLPRGTFWLQPRPQRRPASSRLLATLLVVAPIVALAFLVVRCVRKTSVGGSSAHGLEHRYLAVGGLSSCDTKDDEEDGTDPSQPLSHSQLSLLILSPAEANRLSPQDLQTISRAKEKLLNLLRTVAKLQRQAEESAEQERNLNADLAIADQDRAIMDAAASSALRRRKRGKAGSASEKLEEYKEILRTMELQQGQYLQELLLVARSFSVGRQLSFVGAAALVASMRINNPEIAMPAALKPNELLMLKEFTETIISEGRIYIVRMAFLARSSRAAVPKAKEFVKLARATVSYLEQAGMNNEAKRLSEVVKELEELIGSLPPVGTISRTQSLLRGVAEGRDPSQTSARTAPAWLRRGHSQGQHRHISLTSGTPYKDTASARGPNAPQQDLPQLELLGVPAPIIPPPLGADGEPILSVPFVPTPSGTDPLDGIVPVDDPSPTLTKHTLPSADATLSSDKTVTPSGGPALSARPSLDGAPPSVSGTRVAQKLKTWVQRAKSAISVPTQERRGTSKLELLLHGATKVFGEASAAELAAHDVQRWVNEARTLIDGFRSACSARWRLQCAQQRLSLLNARESLIFARAASPRGKLPRKGDALLHSIMEIRAMITVANRSLDDLKPLSTTPWPFPQLADALQNLQSEAQEAENALKEEAGRIASQLMTALQGSTEGEPAAASAAPSSFSVPTSSIILQVREVLVFLKQWIPSSLEVQALEEQLRNSSLEEALADSAPSRWRNIRRSLSLRRRKSEKQSKESEKEDKH